MHRADVAVGIALILVGMTMAGLTLGFPPAAEAIGPSFFPRLVSAALIVLGALVIGQARRAVSRHGARVVRFERGFTLRALALTGSLVLYLLLLAYLPSLGFPFLTPPLLFVVGLIFRGRPGPALLVSSIATAELTYAFFRLWLGLPLARSAWF